MRFEPLVPGKNVMSADADRAHTPALALPFDSGLLQSVARRRGVRGRTARPATLPRYPPAPLFGLPLGLQTRPQTKTRRLGRAAAPAVLPAAHTSTALLHGLCSAFSSGPGDPAVSAEGTGGGRWILTFRPPRDQCLSEMVEPCAETTLRARTEFLRGGTNRCYGAGDEKMATSSLHLTMECRDAPAERLEQIPRHPGPE
jgi:hypothetical protein